jgi:hypothetical protein
VNDAKIIFRLGYNVSVSLAGEFKNRRRLSLPRRVSAHFY